LPWLVVRLLLLRPEVRGLQRKRRLRVALVTPLILPFAQQILSPWNPAKEREKLPKMFPMLRYKRLPVL
jgi:hypothetical protein